MNNIISDYGECIVFIVAGLIISGIFLWMINAFSAI